MQIHLYVKNQCKHFLIQLTWLLLNQVMSNSTHLISNNEKKELHCNLKLCNLFVATNKIKMFTAISATTYNKDSTVKLSNNFDR